MEDPVKLEDIEVVGERIRRRVDPNVGIGVTVYSVWDGAGWKEFDPFNSEALDELFDGRAEILERQTMPTVRISRDIDKNHPEYPRVLAASIAIAKNINSIDNNMRQLDNAERIFLLEENTMTGAELKNLWFSISYIVDTNNYGPGRGGQVLTDTGTGLSTSYVNVSTIEGYENHAQEFGIKYYLLHELAHTTIMSRLFNAGKFMQYTRRRDSEGNPDPQGQFYYESPEGILAERYTNAMTRIFSGYIGSSIWTNPPHGDVYP